jgi:hypothetical protein
MRHERFDREQTHRITGNVRIEDRAKGRVWVAAYVKADGAKSARRSVRLGSRSPVAYAAPGRSQAYSGEHWRCPNRGVAVWHVPGPFPIAQMSRGRKVRKVCPARMARVEIAM